MLGQFGECRRDLGIAAEMESIDGEDVTVSFSHGVETIDGLGDLTVSAADVIWL